MACELLAHIVDTSTMLSYYSRVVLNTKASSIEVQLDLNEKGKGIVATRNISEGETVFVERPLVHLQHSDNQCSAVVCSQCLRFIGSIERQVGHKLQSLVAELGRGAKRTQVQSEGHDNDDDDSEVDLEEALEAGERLEQIYSHVTPERIATLCSGTTILPMSDGFQLPDEVPCRRGCGTVYCGVACESAAWEHSHCLLCPALKPSPAAATSLQLCQPSSSNARTSTATVGAFARPMLSSAASQPSISASEGCSGCIDTCAVSGPSSPLSADEAEVAATEELHGIFVNRSALAAFFEHARETNEIFLLAAKVVAATLLRAAKILEDSDEAVAIAAARFTAGDETGLRDPVAAATGPAAAEASIPANSKHKSALLAAWQPYMYGWKRCWWECVAVPDDVDDEEDFREQLRSLASDSLELLSAAISDPRFGPDLLQLEVFGSIVGMFELNNMGLLLSSPVEDYFLAVDNIEEGSEKQAILKETQPVLNALDTEYATACKATAFLALQSCINHSCDPNCTASCDFGDCTVAVQAVRDISAGEEILLPYIDISLPYKERQAELRDYGFVCRCPRCVVDAAAVRSRRQGAGGSKGVKVGRRR